MYPWYFIPEVTRHWTAPNEIISKTAIHKLKKRGKKEKKQMNVVHIDLIKISPNWSPLLPKTSATNHREEKKKVDKSSPLQN